MNQRVNLKNCLLQEARRSFESDSVSPFYGGRYGSASSHRRATLQPKATLSPYARERIQARPISSGTSPSSVILSRSAKRILQALESMSTPVKDARIPVPSTNRRSTFLQDEDASFTGEFQCFETFYIVVLFQPIFQIAGFAINRRRPTLGPPVKKLSVSTPVQVVNRPLPPTVKTPAKRPASSDCAITTRRMDGKVISLIFHPPAPHPAINAPPAQNRDELGCKPKTTRKRFHCQ